METVLRQNILVHHQTYCSVVIILHPVDLDVLILSHFHPIHKAKKMLTFSHRFRKIFGFCIQINKLGFFFLSVSSPPALPPKKRQSAPSPTRVAVVAPMSRATSGSSLPIGICRPVCT